MPRKRKVEFGSDWIIDMRHGYTCVYRLNPGETVGCGERRDGPTLVRILDVPSEVPFWEVAQKSMDMKVDPPLFFRPWDLVLKGEYHGESLKLAEASLYLGLGADALKWHVRQGNLASFRPRKKEGGNRGHCFNKLDLDWFKSNIYIGQGRPKND
ncbi:MAG: hypothetical protein LBP92_09010 [Deltaproteobacteria bacterium]|jgi:hypothetical protein|nr:hypothetical protein [Deltaproteobacteria bacterium]